jgi:anti-sigma B factor antagonist
MSDIQIDVEHGKIRPGISLVRVAGLIDTNTASRVGMALHKLVSESHYRIVFDLSKVEYISSAGWGIFIGEIRQIRHQGGDLKLAALVPEVEEIFKVLEFDSILKAYSSVEEAVADFAPTN